MSKRIKIEVWVEDRCGGMDLVENATGREIADDVLADIYSGISEAGVFDQLYALCDEDED